MKNRIAVILLMITSVASRTKKQEEELRKIKSERREIDVYMVFDYAVYKKWDEFEYNGKSTHDKIKEYYFSLIDEMNYIFGSARDLGINIGVRPSGFRYFTKPNEVPFIQSSMLSNGKLDRNLVHKSFTKWVKDESLMTDHIQLHTGHKLSKNQLGISDMAEVCLEKRTATVFDDLNFGYVAYASTYYLARNLGIPDDDAYDRTCGLGYIMYPPKYRNNRIALVAYGTPVNRWKFSECGLPGLDLMILYLRSLKDDCLRKNNVIDKDAIFYQPSELGVDLTRDQQCKLVFGQDYFYCRDRLKDLNLEDKSVCIGVFCKRTNDRVCLRTVLPYPKTPCRIKTTMGECNHGNCEEAGMDLP